MQWRPAISPSILPLSSKENAPGWVMGRIIVATGVCKKKRSLVFTKIISAVALSLLHLHNRMGSLVEENFPWVWTASGAIINSIGCRLLYPSLNSHSLLVSIMVLNSKATQTLPFPDGLLTWKEIPPSKLGDYGPSSIELELWQVAQRTPRHISSSTH